MTSAKHRPLAAVIVVLVVMGCAPATTESGPSASVAALATISASAVPTSVAGASALAAPRSADEIFARVTERYRSARSYRDSGTVSLTFFDEKDEADHASVSRFSTSWAGPSSVRFEFADDLGPKLLWSRAGETTTFNAGKLQAEESLPLALGGFHGITNGTPSVAIERLGCETCSPPAGFELRGTEACGLGAQCFKLVGHEHEDVVAYFVDVSSFAIRKRIEQGTLAPFSAKDLEGLPPEVQKKVQENAKDVGEGKTETVHELEPSFDVPIPPSTFDPLPPKPARFIPL